MEFKLQLALRDQRAKSKLKLELHTCGKEVIQIIRVTFNMITTFCPFARQEVELVAERCEKLLDL